MNVPTCATPAVTGGSSLCDKSSRPCTPRRPRGMAKAGRPRRLAPWTTTPAGRAKLRAEAERKLAQWKARMVKRLTKRLIARANKRFKAEIAQWAKNPKISGGKRIPRVSRGQAGRNRRYRIVRDEFMARQENWNCAVPGCTNRATQVHHVRGRQGVLLCDTRFFHPVCGACHTWIDANRAKARGILAARGTNRGLALLCQPGEFNTPI